jgi:hypothetical protein
MNAVEGRSGKRWLVFPLKFFRGSVEIAASVRLLLNTSNPDLARRVEYCSIDAASPSRYWAFEIFGSGDRGRAVISADPPQALSDGRLRAAFSAALSPLGVDVVFSEERAERLTQPRDSLDPPFVRVDA